ncbi:hypothetical protein BBP40_012007 [Aspergillus hancockii]|nr:hypothetical protein BBP40_012007 [Aspergillus hancockii]
MLGGNDSDLCGERWYESKWDGLFGMEVQTSAASLFISNLFNHKGQAPVTSSTGGKSTNSTSGTAISVNGTRNAQSSATGGSNNAISTDTPNGSSRLSGLSELAVAGVLAGTLATI